MKLFFVLAILCVAVLTSVASKNNSVQSCRNYNDKTFRCLCNSHHSVQWFTPKNVKDQTEIMSSHLDARCEKNSKFRSVMGDNGNKNLKNNRIDRIADVLKAFCDTYHINYYAYDKIYKECVGVRYQKGKCNPFWTTKCDSGKKWKLLGLEMYDWDYIDVITDYIGPSIN